MRFLPCTGADLQPRKKKKKNKNKQKKKKKKKNRFAAPGKGGKTAMQRRIFSIMGGLAKTRGMSVIEGWDEDPASRLVVRQAIVGTDIGAAGLKSLES